VKLLNKIELLKFLDRTAGAFLCVLLATTQRRPSPGSPCPAPDHDIVRRILVIRPGGMGDMVILLPVIRALREKFAGAAIDVVCEKRNVDVLTLAGMGQEAMVYDTNPLRFLSSLIRRKYDITIDSEQFHHFSAVFALLSRAAVRIGFGVNPRRNPLYTHLVDYDKTGPEGLQFLKLLEPLGIRNARHNHGQSLDTGNIAVSSAEAHLLRQLDGRQCLVIHPTGSTPYKRWEPDKFVRLIKQLYSELHMDIVLAGGEQDREIAKQILAGTADMVNGSVFSFAGEFSLLATAAVIRQATLFVGCDSGLAHLAIALGTPTVVLFGPSDHLKWGYEGQAHAVIRKNLPCSPCFMFGYSKPCRTIACMRDITEEEVATACRRVLEEARSLSSMPRKVSASLPRSTANP